MTRATEAGRWHGGGRRRLNAKGNDRDSRDEVFSTIKDNLDNVVINRRLS